MTRLDYYNLILKLYVTHLVSDILVCFQYLKIYISVYQLRDTFINRRHTNDILYTHKI